MEILQKYLSDFSTSESSNCLYLSQLAIRFIHSFSLALKSGIWLWLRQEGTQLSSTKVRLNSTHDIFQLLAIIFQFMVVFHCIFVDLSLTFHESLENFLKGFLRLWQSILRNRRIQLRFIGIWTILKVRMILPIQVVSFREGWTEWSFVGIIHMSQFL